MPKISSVKQGPRPVDVHVGSRVRLRRTMLGLSQTKLGAAINLTFQQVQKYERGTNRIGASRLWQIAKVLDVPVSFFFDDMPPEISGRPQDMPTAEARAIQSRETMELCRAYYRLEPYTRAAAFKFIKALARQAPMAEAAE